MTYPQIAQEVLTLNEAARTALLLTLLDKIPGSPDVVTDAEATRRERELETGEFAALCHEEFVRRVNEERRKWTLPFGARRSGTD